MRSLGAAEDEIEMVVGATLSAADCAGSRQISFDEFSAGAAHLFATGEEALRRAFSLFDANANGTIDKEEFGRMLGKIGLDEVARCPEEVERIFAAADADCDGGVTFAEFKGLLTQTVQARQARRGP